MGSTKPAKAREVTETDLFVVYQPIDDAHIGPGELHQLGLFRLVGFDRQTVGFQPVLVIDQLPYVLVIAIAMRGTYVRFVSRLEILHDGFVDWNLRTQVRIEMLQGSCPLGF